VSDSRIGGGGGIDIINSVIDILIFFF